MYVCMYSIECIMHQFFDRHIRTAQMQRCMCSTFFVKSRVHIECMSSILTYFSTITALESKTTSCGVKRYNSSCKYFLLQRFSYLKI